MTFLDRMERKFGWLAFPGFLRYYALLHALVYILQIFRPDIGLLLDFDRKLILDGEIWRIITFLFASSGFGGAGGLGLLFTFFMVMIAFMMSDALESAWGEFRASLFFYSGAAGLIAANFLYAKGMPGSGLILYTSAFFAFATLFPKVEFRVFFVIPVQVRFLAIFGAVVLLLPVLSEPLRIPYFVLGLANYVLFAGIPALRGKAMERVSVARRKEFKAAKTPSDAAFHMCVVCNRSDVSNPELDFRIDVNGQEYCEDHLPDVSQRIS